MSVYTSLECSTELSLAILSWSARTVEFSSLSWFFFTGTICHGSWFWVWIWWWRVGACYSAWHWLAIIMVEPCVLQRSATPSASHPPTCYMLMVIQTIPGRSDLYLQFFGFCWCCVAGFEATIRVTLTLLGLARWSISLWSPKTGPSLFWGRCLGVTCLPYCQNGWEFLRKDLKRCCQTWTFIAIILWLCHSVIKSLNVYEGSAGTSPMAQLVDWVWLR